MDEVGQTSQQEEEERMMPRNCPPIPPTRKIFVSCGGTAAFEIGTGGPLQVQRVDFAGPKDCSVHFERTPDFCHYLLSRIMMTMMMSRPFSGRFRGAPNFHDFAAGAERDGASSGRKILAQVVPVRAETMIGLLGIVLRELRALLVAVQHTQYYQVQ